MVVIRGAGTANSLAARGVTRVYYMYYIIRLVVSSISVEARQCGVIVIVLA
jgi:hypothetical protein